MTFAVISQVAWSSEHGQARHVVGVSPRDQRPARVETTMDSPRSQILNLAVLAGDLCRMILIYAPMDLQDSSHHREDAEFLVEGKEEVGHCAGSLFLGLLYASNMCAIDLIRYMLKKIQLNGRKYPVELAKVSAILSFQHHVF